MLQFRGHHLCLWIWYRSLHVFFWVCSRVHRKFVARAGHLWMHFFWCGLLNPGGYKGRAYLAGDAHVSSITECFPYYFPQRSLIRSNRETHTRIDDAHRKRMCSRCFMMIHCARFNNISISLWTMVNDGNWNNDSPSIRSFCVCVLSVLLHLCITLYAITSTYCFTVCLVRVLWNVYCCVLCVCAARIISLGLFASVRFCVNTQLSFNLANGIQITNSKYTLYTLCAALAVPLYTAQQTHTRVHTHTHGVLVATLLCDYMA